MWADLPAELNPLAGKVPPARAERKRTQIEALLHWALQLLPPPAAGPAAAAGAAAPTVVDFCCGGGHLGLVVAALRPDVAVVLLDLKQPALDHAERRAAAMDLSNIRTFCGAVGDYSDSFDLALALHSCGGAADAVQAAAIKAGNQSSQSSPQLDFQDRISRVLAVAGASYVIAPCCYGFVQAAAEDHEPIAQQPGASASSAASASSRDEKLLLVADLQYPRSQAYRDIPGLSAKLYAAVAGSGDATYWPADERAGAHDGLARACMEAIDRDRTLLAAEAGYIAAVTTMTRATAPGNTAGKQGVVGAADEPAGEGGRAGVDESGLKDQLLIGWKTATSSAA